MYRIHRPNRFVLILAAVIGSISHPNHPRLDESCALTPPVNGRMHPKKNEAPTWRIQVGARISAARSCFSRIMNRGSVRIRRLQDWFFTSLQRRGSTLAAVIIEHLKEMLHNLGIKKRTRMFADILEDIFFLPAGAVRAV